MSSLSGMLCAREWELEVRSWLGTDVLWTNAVPAPRAWPPPSESSSSVRSLART